MSTATGQKVRVRIVATEAGGAKLDRPPGPGGLRLPAFRKGEVVEAGIGEAEGLVRSGFAEFVDRVKLRTLADDVQVGNRCCAAGEVVEVPAHHASRYMSRGLAERVE